jgi:hypothetical protein
MIDLMLYAFPFIYKSSNTLPVFKYETSYIKPTTEIILKQLFQVKINATLLSILYE